VKDPVKPTLPIDFAGSTGNSFVILATARDVTKEWCKAVFADDWYQEFKAIWNPIYKDATSGDRDHLIAVMQENFYCVTPPPQQEWIPMDGKSRDGSFVIELE